MANMLDYLDWRGDLTFEQSPFNMVDNMILSYLAYVKLDGIPEITGERSAAAEEVSKIFFRMHSEKELAADKSFVAAAPRILRKMAASRRFRHAVIRNYVNKIDEKIAMQFAAMEIALEDGTSYIAFRGTDDTVVGWKEDFNLSNGAVPADLEAVKYLNEVGAKSDALLRVGGHSKGGNLSIFGAVCCRPEIQERIIEIYSNDGPGYEEAFIRSPEFQAQLPKIIRIIPESSVIGMLLSHAAEPILISSSEKAVLQHDGFSWEVLGNSFVRVKELDGKAAAFDKIVKGWLAGMSEDQRGLVVDDLFSLLEATGADTLTELQNQGLKNLPAVFKQIETLHPETKDHVADLAKAVAAHWRDWIAG